MNNELLNKSIDSLLDEIFSEPVEKAEVINNTKADDVKAPSSQDDAKRNAGRSKEGNSNEEITEKQKEDEPEEAKKQSKDKNQIKKSEENQEVESLTKSEKAELEELRKAKKDEELKKAELEKEALIKSIVEKTAESVASRYESLMKSQSDEISDLKKSLAEQSQLLNAMANKPQRVKSVTNINALEKSEGPSSDSKHHSRAEVLSVIEDLVMKKSLPIEVATEYERSGGIARPEYRNLIEKALNK